MSVCTFYHTSVCFFYDISVCTLEISISVSTLEISTLMGGKISYEIKS